jgi:Cd2+/Zn2+-exporting ATPase
VRRHDGSAPAAPAAASTARHQRWWQTKKGKHVLAWRPDGSAYAIAQFVPGYAEWIFAAAVIAGVLPFARKAFALAVSGSPFSIETLMVVASLGALVIGEAEEAAAVVFLFAIGELLESVAAGRARAGIKALASLVPKTAVLLDAAGGQREVPAASLRVSDRVLVRPGDRVPADGKILRGESSLDESPITGESVPRQKAIGADVFAGSINVDGVLEVQVEKTASDNTISRIIQLVEQAQSSKAPTARFIEKFSRYYTPAVMAIAALIVVVPPLAMGGDWGTWLYRGLALLLIACPCALVLSTPAAIAWPGGGHATGPADQGWQRVGNHRPRARHCLRQDWHADRGQAAHHRGPALRAVQASTGPCACRRCRVRLKPSLGEGHCRPCQEPGRGDSPGHGRIGHCRQGGARHRERQCARCRIARPCGTDGHADSRAPQEIDKLEDGGKTVVVLFDEASKNVLGLLALRDEPAATRAKAWPSSTPWACARSC